MGDVILELLEFIKKEHQQIRENYIEVTKEAMIEMKQLRELLEKVVLAVESLDKTHIAAAQKRSEDARRYFEAWKGVKSAGRLTSTASPCGNRCDRCAR